MKITRAFSKLFFSFALVLTLTACNTSDDTSKTSAPVLGTIDTVRILQESVPGKEAIAYLQSLQDSAIEKIKVLEAQKNAADEKNDEEESMRIMGEIQSIVYRLQEELKVKQEAIFADISERLTKIVEKYRNDNNITAIFNKTDIISSDPSADISDGIMTEFNKESIDFDAILESYGISTSDAAADSASSENSADNTTTDSANSENSAE